MDCRKGGGKLIVSVIDSLFQSSNKSYDRFNVANVSGRLIIDTGTIIESPRAPGMSVKYPQGLSCIALTTEE